MASFGYLYVQIWIKPFSNPGTTSQKEINLKAAARRGRPQICTKLKPYLHVLFDCTMPLRNVVVALVWGASCTQTCTKSSHSQNCDSTAACSLKMLLWLEPGGHVRMPICPNFAFLDKRNAKQHRDPNVALGNLAK